MLLYTVVSSLGSGQSRKTWKDIAEFSYHLLLTLCTRFEKLTMSIPSWFKVVTGKVVSLIFFMQKGFLLYWTLLGTGPESWVYFEMCKRGKKLFPLWYSCEAGPTTMFPFSCITDDRVPSSFHTRLLDTRKPQKVHFSLKVSWIKTWYWISNLSN